MLSMMEQEKKTIFQKLILLQHYFLYVVYHVAREKTIFKKLILLQHYFLYVVYHGAREKDDF